MFAFISDLIGSQPILALFLAVGLGYLVGQVNVLGFSLGIGAVLFVGLAIGAFAPKAQIGGPIGLMFVRLAKVYGARVIALGRRTSQLDRALRMGADDALLNTGGDDVQSVAMRTCLTTLSRFGPRKPGQSAVPLPAARGIGFRIAATAAAAEAVASVGSTVSGMLNATTSRHGVQREICSKTRSRSWAGRTSSM